MFALLLDTEVLLLLDKDCCCLSSGFSVEIGFKDNGELRFKLSKRSRSLLSLLAATFSLNKLLALKEPIEEGVPRVKLVPFVTDSRASLDWWR